MSEVAQKLKAQKSTKARLSCLLCRLCWLLRVRWHQAGDVVTSSETHMTVHYMREVQQQHGSKKRGGSCQRKLLWPCSCSMVQYVWHALTFAWHVECMLYQTQVWCTHLNIDKASSTRTAGTGTRSVASARSHTPMAPALQRRSAPDAAELELGTLRDPA